MSQQIDIRAHSKKSEMETWLSDAWYYVKWETKSQGDFFLLNFVTPWRKEPDPSASLSTDSTLLTDNANSTLPSN